MALSRYKTAGAIINGAARELGLPQAADPFASIDPNMKQLVQLYNSLGLALLDSYVWEHLCRAESITTVAGQSEYNLPADYHDIVDETPWNMTSKLPLYGPLTIQKWQERSAQLGSPVYLEFRLTANQLLIASSTAVPGGQNITYFLKSRAWVRPAAAGLGNANTLGIAGSDEAVQYGDYGLYDPLVLHHGLKTLWRRAKQFNSDENMQEFVRALESAKGRSRGHAPLNTAAPRSI